MEIFSGKRKQKTSARVLAMILTLAFLVMSVPLNPAAAIETTENQKTTLVFVIDSNTYTVNGELTVMDVSPVIIEGRTMLPIRYVATPLGAEIGWDGETSKVTVSLGNTKIELWIGQSNALVNGATVPIDANNPNVKPLIISDRTMLPIRFVTENLGCDVQWDEITKKVTITKTETQTGTSIPSVTLKPSVEIIKPDFKPGVYLPEEEQIDFQPEDSLSATDLKELFAPPQDYQKIAPKQELKVDWNSRQVGKSFKVKVEEKDIPIVTRLGRGYNVFGQYAHVDSLKQPVLDIEKLLQDQKVEAIRYDHGYDDSNTARSIRSYSSQMSTALNASGKYLGFGGSVKVNFDSSRTEQLDNYFATYSWIVKKYGVYIDGTINLKNYLLPNAMQMINDKNIPAKTVFATFGHYVLVDSITGGRIDHSITANSRASTSFENFKIATKADFNALVAKASGSASYQNVQNRSEYESSKDENFDCYGGGFIINSVSLKNDPSLLDQWEKTLEEHGNLVEFGNTTTRPLVPIWELCSDSARAAYLKAEFEKMNISMANNNKWPVEKYVEDVTFVVAGNEFAARAQCSAGYQLVNADLNAGAGGDYIYLCYKLSENADDAITDFFMEYTGSGAPSTTTTVSHNANNVPYTRIGIDLNQGAGGNFIYLWYTKAKTKTPVKAMAVTFGAEGLPDYEPVFWLNSQSPADVNKSVGGATIIIKYKR
ncbi:MAG: stalk domain-containing protein [Desulfotomaculaceae bacterium]|nr:stalk domain-containing protein [Desulfotomaculaceae bacterium]